MPILSYGYAAFVVGVFALAHFVDPNVFRFEVSLGNLATIAALLWGVYQINHVATEFRVTAKQYMGEHNIMWTAFTEERGIPIEEERAHKWRIKKPVPKETQ